MGNSSLDEMLSDEEFAETVEEEIVDEVEVEDVPETDAEDPAPEVEVAAVEEDPRDKELLGLKAALQETRGELRAYKATQAPRPAPQAPPDVFEDPQGYQAHVMQTTQQIAQNVKLDLSEDMTRTAHGDAVVDAAFEAFQESADPATRASVMSAKSPWNEVVKWHKRQEISKEIGDDPAAWMERQRAEIRAELQSEAGQVAKSVTQQVGKAPSLASEPNLGNRSAPSWNGPQSLEDILG